MTDLTSVSIETTSGTLTLDYLEDSGLAYSNQYTWFWNQDGEETPLDTDLAEDLVSTVTGLTWNACVDYQADEDSLGTYGLDIPAATITVEYTESTQVETNETDENGDPIYETQETPATFVLELGDYDGDTCYARISGSSMVYRVDGTVADTLLAAKGEDLLPQDVVLMDWSDVTSVEINLDGTTYSLEKPCRRRPTRTATPPRPTSTSWTARPWTSPTPWTASKTWRSPAAIPTPPPARRSWPSPSTRIRRTSPR